MMNLSTNALLGSVYVRDPVMVAGNTPKVGFIQCWKVPETGDLFEGE